MASTSRQTSSVFGTPDDTRDSSPRYVTPPEEDEGSASHVDVDALDATMDMDTDTHPIPAGGRPSSFELASVAAHSAPAPAATFSTNQPTLSSTLAAPPASTQPQPNPSNANATSETSKRPSPWDPSTRVLYKARFTTLNPAYKNKMRLSDPTFHSIRTLLLHPSIPATSLLATTLPPSNPNHPSRLKERAKSWILRPMTDRGYLYRVDGTTFRRHVSEAEAWSVLTKIHVETGHKGRDRMFEALKQKYVGYTLDEVMFVLQHCRVCEERKKANGAVMMPWNGDTTWVPDEGDVFENAPPSPGLAGLPVEPPPPPVVAGPSPAQMRYYVQDANNGRLKATAAAYVQPPAVRPPNMHMPVNTGLVHYDVPDWYAKGT